jgi:hypothetical protein
MMLISIATYLTRIIFLKFDTCMDFEIRERFAISMARSHTLEELHIIDTKVSDQYFINLGTELAKKESYRKL